MKGLPHVPVHGAVAELPGPGRILEKQWGSGGGRAVGTVRVEAAAGQLLAEGLWARDFLSCRWRHRPRSGAAVRRAGKRCPARLALDVAEQGASDQTAAEFSHSLAAVAQRGLLIPSSGLAPAGSQQQGD